MVVISFLFIVSESVVSLQPQHIIITRMFVLSYPFGEPFGVVKGAAYPLLRHYCESTTSFNISNFHWRRRVNLNELDDDSSFIEAGFFWLISRVVHWN